MKLKEYLVCGTLGAIIIILLIVFIGIFCGIYDFKCIYILNSDVDKYNLSLESLKNLKRLEDCGLLLTPSEYTNHVISFYNVLLTFVGIVLVIFSIASYIIIRDNNTKETRKVVKEFINDSKIFRQEIVSSLSGEFDSHYVSKDEHSNDLEALSARINDLENARETEIE